jgi:hypothetical protein
MSTVGKATDARELRNPLLAAPLTAVEPEEMAISVAPGGARGHAALVADDVDNASSVTMPRHRCCGSWRLAVVVVLFFANISLYVARSNISIAVIYIFTVCDGGNASTASPTALTCYDLETATWLQSDVLGAFYIGYFVSQMPAGTKRRIARWWRGYTRLSGGIATTIAAL